GTMTDDGAVADPVDEIVQSSTTTTFRRGIQHWILHTTDGVALGKYAKTDGASYDGHVTGWSAEAFPLSARALSWDAALSNGARARVRIARDDAGAWSGRFKVYAGPNGEQLEEDASHVAFDGKTLAFEGPISRVDAIASGRTLEGTATTGGEHLSLHGT